MRCVKSKQQVYLPAQLAWSGGILGNPIQQLHRPERCDPAEVGPHRQGRISGYLATSADGTRTLVVPRPMTSPTSVDAVLVLAGRYIPEGRKYH